MRETIKEQIVNIDNNICQNIKSFNDENRGFISQNILKRLRDLVEHIALFLYANGNDIENTHDNIIKAIKFIKANGRFRLISKFHKLLQISTSHYTWDEENSERLMLKYYEYLIKLKNFMKDNNIDILENIENFPIDMDATLKEYYEKIAEKLDISPSPIPRNEYTERYYIQKKKPFFFKGQIYYEITFVVANDNVSKFNRIIAFTKIDILPNYAVKLSVYSSEINILNQKTPILIINNYEVAVRQCEINHFADFFGKHQPISINNKEYKFTMNLLKKANIDLSELVQLDDIPYSKIKNKVSENSDVMHLFGILDKCRDIIKNNKAGKNIISYLLYILNNKILKLQKNEVSCNHLSDLFVKYGCIPFDEMPFNTSLLGHNPKLYDVFQCVDSSDREHELFARFIQNNAEQKGKLYTKIKDVKDIDSLIDEYNKNLYYKHKPARQLEKKSNYIYIHEYENNVYKIITKLKKLTENKVKGYSESTKKWIIENPGEIDCEEKKVYLTKMFENSIVALVYGAAGTGKSTLINHISNRFNSYKKIYLANTNPAIDNLKRKVNSANTEFMTIAKFLSKNNNNIDCTVLFIDECSTVSNKDMIKILEKANFKLLVLVGDVCQIESIVFGNWFDLVRSFLPQDAICELIKPYRAEDQNLLDFWKSLRTLEENILEVITKNKYSNILDDSIFSREDKDKIILCLNYDGLYGINNINNFLQVSNSSAEVQWGGQIYKVGDPILFNEASNFSPVIHNNLKGKIYEICREDEGIYFSIEIDKLINEMEAEYSNLKFIKNSKNGSSIIRFYVNKHKSYDEDDPQFSNTVMPFQIAYAVSIHKAQGLEYNSVKIIITEEVDEMITHNIFYTAVTRARKKLKIYWSPETEKKVLNNFEKKDNKVDVGILKDRYSELK